MGIRAYFPPAGWVWFLLFAALIGSGGQAYASVSGKYLSASGNALVLSLNLAQGSSAIIVEQQISAGNRVISTSPPAGKVDAGEEKSAANGCLKMFRREISPSPPARLSAPLKGKLSAVVRYRQPGSGQFTEVTIRP